jgi:hypothetical protein
MIKIYKNIIYLIICYEYENVSLMLRREHRLKVFENRVLKKIFGSKRDKVTGD